MNSDQTKILSDIKAITDELDQSHNTDPDYLSPHLRKLKTYILQVHASYETSLELIIFKDYLKSSESFLSFRALFERMTFYDKQRLVHSIHPTFPNARTTKINKLRNDFAHQKGQDVRNTYNTDAKLLEVYQLLKQANDELNNFFAVQQAAENQGKDLSK